MLHRGQGVRRLVDAHERQRRIDRDGAKSAHGEASRLVVIAECGQDDHPARKAGHDLPEPGGLDHDGIVVREVVKNTCLQLWKRLTCLLVGHVLDLFSPPVRDWFRASFAEPTAVQEQGWREVGAGRHVLMAAPTGSGKTLAAFLWCLDRLSGEPTPAEAERCRVLYVSPLKALAHDVDRNLRSPLVGIRRQMESQGLVPPDISVAIRTGDTPADVRRSMERHPPDILITTPESLFLILTSAARKILAPVRWLIVDEIHSVASTKRGSHLALSLERLCELTRVEPQRIGLSATQRPLEEVGRFLGGMDRQVSIVDAGRLKTMEVRVEVPVEDMTRLTDEDEDSAKGQNSIWPAIYPRLLQLIREHRSTIVFVNSRRLAERIAARVNDLAEEELVRAHHGSIAREQRMLIEDELKAGRLRGLVATSTLELGIDMGAVDLVLQIEAPPSVAAGIQRVGRAGHSVGEVSRGVVMPKFRGDLLESAAVVEGMLEGRIESTVVPRKPLDVLAQQIVAMCALDEWEVEKLGRVVRRAYPYGDLGPLAFESVLDMLSGRYPSDQFVELRPRIVWDRVAGKVRGRHHPVAGHRHSRPGRAGEDRLLEGRRPEPPSRAGCRAGQDGARAAFA
ncbi:MAG: DEAD/DEAH box helicase [Chloroflexi bacterium]|nr:MAG: DEAD/DEAH box helicase [Chloroflexota bacterium]